ncbi:MAG: T9SS type A sorting domain-containing protein [Candidatus Kapabacteria bacterium]|nr:T9SS type A sorting domain-containing protein [Candidatus Kapabacteria bacterium]
MRLNINIRIETSLVLFTVLVTLTKTVIAQPCELSYYQSPDCFSSYQGSWSDPRSAGTEHWTPQGIQPQHIIYYYYNFGNNRHPDPNIPARTVSFNPGLLGGITTNCMSNWVNGCSGFAPGIQFSSQSATGWFWTWDPNAIVNNSYMSYTGVIVLRANTSNLVQILNSSSCSPYANNTQRQSYILFNNSAELYIRSPQYRWTTSACPFPAMCGQPNIKCISFHNELMANIGLYIGLGPTARNSPNRVMRYTTPDRIWECEPLALSECDIDNLKRRYCWNLLNNVEDENSANNVTTIPTPINDRLQINLSYQGGKGLNSIRIYDLIGNLVYVLDNIDNDNNDKIDIDVSRLLNGTYSLQLILNTGQVYNKIIVKEKK